MPYPIPANEARRVAALHRYKLLDTAPEDPFDDFARLASIVCETPIALMSLIDTDRQWFKARIGLEGTETPREHAFCSYTILGDETLVVEDAQLDERFANNPFVTSGLKVRFYAGAPLVDREGNALGSLCVVDQRPRQLTETQLTALKIISRRVIEQVHMRSISNDLAVSLQEVRELSGLLPICSHCKSIRDDRGYWKRVECYVREHSNAEFSHGFCPPCMKKYYPEVYANLVEKGLL